MKTLTKQQTELTKKAISIALFSIDEERRRLESMELHDAAETLACQMEELKKLMTHLETQQDVHITDGAANISPTPVTESGEITGIRIPIINKTLMLSKSRKMNWDDAVRTAADASAALPTKEELYILRYFSDEIEKYLPGFSKSSIWTGPQYGTRHAGAMDPNGESWKVYKDTSCIAVILL